MTDNHRSTDWSDDRLADAFRARSALRPTPVDLAETAIERVHRAPSIDWAGRGPALAAALAAAAVVAIVVVALVARPAPDRTGDDQSTTFDLPLVSVSGAIAIRDAGVDDREIAVHGFYAAAAQLPACPAPPNFGGINNPARPWCPMTLTWLMEQPEELVNLTSTSVSGHFPNGPAFNPSLSLVDTVGLPTDPAKVVPVTFIGHFDDRRAEFCPVDERSSCVDTFVVDRIDPGSRHTRTVRDLEGSGITEPASTDADIDGLIRRIDPDFRILSRRVVAIERIAFSEPVLGLAESVLPSYVSSAAWFVTAVQPVDATGRAIARTFMVFDGTDNMTEITRDGLVRVVFGVAQSAEPETSRSPAPSPSSSVAPTRAIGSPTTVSGAMGHRDNYLDNTEMLVRGFGWAPAGVIACTPGVDAPPALDQCPDFYTWIGERKPTGTGPEFLRPDGPAFNLLIRLGTYQAVDLNDKPRQIVVLGHFDDPSAAQCDAELVSRCRRNFMADAILDGAPWRSVDTPAPRLSCTGLLDADCGAAADVVLESLGRDHGLPMGLDIGQGVWCPTPGLLFETTSCPGGAVPPAGGGQWIGGAEVTFPDIPIRAYLNIAKDGTVVRATEIAVATPPPVP